MRDRIEWLGALVGIVIIFLCVIMAAFHEIGRRDGYEAGWANGRAAAPDTVIVREPPDPDFIEAFRLDCRWVPRKEAP